MNMKYWCDHILRIVIEDQWFYIYHHTNPYMSIDGADIPETWDQCPVAQCHAKRPH